MEETFTYFVIYYCCFTLFVLAFVLGCQVLGIWGLCLNMASPETMGWHKCLHFFENWPYRNRQACLALSKRPLQIQVTEGHGSQNQVFEKPGCSLNMPPPGPKWRAPLGDDPDRQGKDHP